MEITLLNRMRGYTEFCTKEHQREYQVETSRLASASLLSPRADEGKAGTSPDPAKPSPAGPPALEEVEVTAAAPQPVATEIPTPAVAGPAGSSPAEDARPTENASLAALITFTDGWIAPQQKTTFSNRLGSYGVISGSEEIAITAPEMKAKVAAGFRLRGLLPVPVEHGFELPGDSGLAAGVRPLDVEQRIPQRFPMPQSASQHVPWGQVSRQDTIFDPELSRAEIRIAPRSGRFAVRGADSDGIQPREARGSGQMAAELPRMPGGVLPWPSLAAMYSAAGLSSSGPAKPTATQAPPETSTDQVEPAAVDSQQHKEIQLLEADSGKAAPIEAAPLEVASVEKDQPPQTDQQPPASEPEEESDLEVLGCPSASHRLAPQMTLEAPAIRVPSPALVGLRADAALAFPGAPPARGLVFQAAPAVDAFWIPANQPTLEMVRDFTELPFRPVRPRFGMREAEQLARCILPVGVNESEEPRDLEMRAQQTAAKTPVGDPAPSKFELVTGGLHPQRTLRLRRAGIRHLGTYIPQTKLAPLRPRLVIRPHPEGLIPPPMPAVRSRSGRNAQQHVPV